MSRKALAVFILFELALVSVGKQVENVEVRRASDGRIVELEAVHGWHFARRELDQIAAEDAIQVLRVASVERDFEMPRDWVRGKSKLQYLGLYHLTITPDVFLDLATPPRKILELTACNVGVPDKLAQVPRHTLERAMFERCELKDAEIARVVESGLLDGCWLIDWSGNAVGVETVKAMAEREMAVTDLWLRNTKIDKECVVYLATMRQLDTLLLTGCGLRSEAVEVLAQLPTLRYVEFEDVQLTFDVAAKFCRMSSLDTLDFDDSALTWDERQQLAEIRRRER